MNLRAWIHSGRHPIWTLYFAHMVKSALERIAIIISRHYISPALARNGTVKSSLTIGKIEDAEKLYARMRFK